MLGIEILKRLGSGMGGVDLVDAAVSGTKYAQWTIANDGFTYERHNSGAAVKSVAWINPQSGTDQYEVQATVSSGDIPPGTIGAWLGLAESQTWGWVNQLAQRTCDLLIEIRRVSDSVVVDSATITLFVAGIE